jgi:3,4-dihydroxy 2-butanone 4-phosphate synthase/GTP cyclohydrolase II
LTGDVLGSVRCDCGEQLQVALQYIALEGRGLLLYLRQEGRGIGLNNKILAYALQDQGLDTVEANLHLGFPADGRSYLNAAEILKDLGIHSVRLATNNPEKVKAMEACGIRVVERVQYDIPHRPENHAYLKTKASKLGHLLNLSSSAGRLGEALVDQNGESGSFEMAGVPEGVIISQMRKRLEQAGQRGHDSGVPCVTLSYAQSLDGSIANRPGQPLQLSNPQTQTLTHRLRSLHDAVLVGINTVLSDDPRLTARIVGGRNPQPVVLDGRLRLPLKARLLHPPCVPPIIATTAQAGLAREKRLREAGAQVLRLPSQRNGLVDLKILLRRLHYMGIRSLMVEGGSQVITDFLGRHLVDQIIITIAPRVVGGLHAVTSALPKMRSPGSRLVNVQYQAFAGDLVVFADVEKESKQGKLRALSGNPAASRVD